MAIENDVPIVKTSEDVEAEVANDYKVKPVVGDDQLPDPFHLKDGWLSEKDGVKLWPVVLFMSFIHSCLLSEFNLMLGKMCKRNDGGHGQFFFGSLCSSQICLPQMLRRYRLLVQLTTAQLPFTMLDESSF